MDNNQEVLPIEEGRERDLDQGYRELKSGNWNQAVQIFAALLETDPHSGLACLGRAMAEYRIHDQEELAFQWQEIRESAEFQKALEPAAPDFHQWLRQEMNQRAPAPKEASKPIRPSISRSLSDVSSMTTDRKVVLGFVAIQLILYLMASIFTLKSQPDGDLGPAFLGSLIFTAIFSGLTVVLGSFYVSSFVKEGKYSRIWRIFNNIVGILGAFLSGIMVVAFRSAYLEGGFSAEGNWYSSMAFAVIFFMHLLSLVVPVLLRKIEKNN